MRRQHRVTFRLSDIQFKQLSDIVESNPFGVYRQFSDELRAMIEERWTELHNAGRIRTRPVEGPLELFEPKPADVPPLTVRHPDPVSDKPVKEDSENGHPGKPQEGPAAGPATEGATPAKPRGRKRGADRAGAARPRRKADDREHRPGPAAAPKPKRKGATAAGGGRRKAGKN